MRSFISAGLLALAWLPASEPAAAASSSPESPVTLTRPDLYYLDHSDVSPPLRDLPMIPPGQGAQRRREINAENALRRGPQVPAPPGWVDPLEARSKAPLTAVAVTAGLNFDGVGVGLGSYSTVASPPDTNGAAGATQYVQWVNLHFAVFSKATGALVYGPAAGSTLWQGFGGICETSNSGDPIATYDKAAGRWVMTQFAFPPGGSSTGPWYQCVAVSTTSDATGSYRRFAYEFTALNDYPKVGVWPDGYYITFNMFHGNLSGGRTCVMDRNNMISAAGTPGPIQCFQLSSFWSLLPADLDGSTPPPAGAPNYQVNLGSGSLRLWRFSVNWAAPSLTTLTGPTAFSVAPFAAPGAINQPGTPQTLDSLSDRLMYRLAYRNFGSYDTMVVNHAVATGTAASGVRWYEIRNPGGVPFVHQQGTFSPDGTARWMGSIAMDKSGDIALGYSVASSSVFPGIRYTGRVPADPLGTLQAETVLVDGGGSQLGLSRWGDYSAMSIDPVDDCTFWYTTEYLKTNGAGTWSTRVGSFKFPGCGIPFTPASLTVINEQCRALNTAQWSASQYATRYELYRSPYSDFRTQTLEYSGSGTFDTVTATSTTYLRVRACNSIGCSDYRNGNAPAKYFNGCL